MSFLAEHYISISVTVMILVMVFIHFNLKDRNANKYIALALLGVDLLPASMAITWASSQGEGLTSGLFVLGFISFVALKLLLVWLLHKALSNGNTQGVWSVVGTMMIIYGVILAAAAFNGSISGAKGAAQEAISSAPIQSIDAQILAAENKLAGLSTFSDSGKAANQAGTAKRLNAQLALHQAALERCPANYLTKCINPNNRKIEAVQRQLSSLTYYAGNQDYSGTLSHLAALQDRRSTLLSSGGIASTSGLGADDKFLARIFGGDVDAARDWKLFIFMIIFDFITIIIRIVVTFVNRGINDAELLSDQVYALAKAGHNSNQIIAIMAANSGLTQLPDKTNQDAFNGGVTGTDNNADQTVSEPPQNGDPDSVTDYTRTVDTIGLSRADSVYSDWSESVRNGETKCTTKESKMFILKQLSGGGRGTTITPTQAVVIYKGFIEKGVQAGWLEHAMIRGQPSVRLTP